MGSDYAFLNFNSFFIMRAFLVLMGEGYIIVGEKVMASLLEF